MDPRSGAVSVRHSLTALGYIGYQMALANYSQARSFSPTQAAIIARFLIRNFPSNVSFFHWKKLNRPRAARKASFSRPKAPSITPSTHDGKGQSG